MSTSAVVRVVWLATCFFNLVVCPVKALVEVEICMYVLAVAQLQVAMSASVVEPEIALAVVYLCAVAVVPAADVCCLALAILPAAAVLYQCPVALLVQVHLAVFLFRRVLQ